MSRAGYISIVLLMFAGCTASTHHAAAEEPGREPVPEASPDKVPTDQQLIIKTGDLTKQLGAKEYKKRERAQAEILKLLHDGRGGTVLTHLREACKTADDPEVKTRLERILEPYDTWDITPAFLDTTPDIAEMLTRFPQLDYREPGTGKSVRNALIMLGEPAVPPLVKVLQGRDKKLRKQAAEILGEISSAKAVEALIKALKDPEHDVQQEAATALGKIGDRRATKPLLETLMSPDRFPSGCAAIALSWIADESTLEPLLKALKSDYSWVRSGAATALGAIKSERAVDALVELLEGKYGSPSYSGLGDSMRIRSSAIRALGRIASDKAVEALIEELGKIDDYITAEILGKVGDTRAVKPLIEALCSGGHILRWSAAVALHEIGGKEAADALVPVLKHDDENVRRCAAITLGRIGDKRAVEPLTALLKDTDIYDRSFAAKALGEIGDERAVPPLKEMFREEKNGIARAGAAGGLFRLTGDENAFEFLIESTKNENFSICCSAVLTLEKLNDERAAEALIALLGDKNNDMYGRVCEALEKMVKAGVVRPVIEALRHENWDIRVTVRTILRNVTKQDFRFDSDKWREWFEKNKEK